MYDYPYIYIFLFLGRSPQATSLWSQETLAITTAGLAAVIYTYGLLEFSDPTVKYAWALGYSSQWNQHYPYLKQLQSTWFCKTCLSHRRQGQHRRMGSRYTEAERYRAVATLTRPSAQVKHGPRIRVVTTVVTASEGGAEEAFGNRETLRPRVFTQITWATWDLFAKGTWIRRTETPRTWWRATSFNRYEGEASFRWTWKVFCVGQNPGVKRYPRGWRGKAERGG